MEDKKVGILPSNFLPSYLLTFLQKIVKNTKDSLRAFPRHDKAELKNNIKTCHPELVSGSKVGATNPPQPSLKKGGSLRAFPRPNGERARVRGKAAFTLAEVLITLGIIGVVAAIVMPTLLTNIQDKIQEKRVQNIKQKFSKATDKMLVTSGLNNYGSTAAFVKELQKHLKMAKVCDNSNIAKCWPYEKVKLDDGKEWEISKTKTAKTLKMKKDDSHEWDDTMAFITADGTSFIVSYNKKCDEDESRSVTWSADQSSSTNCTAMVFDWNGSSKPNTFKKDVIAFNAEGLGTDCAIEVNGKCFGAPFSPTPITQAECEELKGSLGINACGFNTDYWAGAVKKCGGVDNMATIADLTEIANLLYEGGTYSGKASQFSFPEPNFIVWSGEELSSYGANYRCFGFTYAVYSGYGDRNTSDSLGLCLAD